jgi:ComF family protein
MNFKNNPIEIIKRIFINTRDFVYPPLCTICDNPLAFNNPWFCTECIDKLVSNNHDREVCPRCSINKKKSTCTCQYAWDHYFQSVYSLFDFDEQVQHIIHHIKYKGKKSLAFYVGKEYGSFIPDPFFEGIDSIIPVPLHFFRKMKRGYNQAEYFAQGIIQARNQHIPFLKNALRRIKHTKTQTQFTREERKQNLSEAFAVNPESIDLIRGKKLILVDDVVTTGATTDICARVLCSAGALSVTVISIART